MFAQAKAQAVANVLNPDYVPAPHQAELFALQNSFIYSVLDLKVTTSNGIKILQDHAETSDGQKVFRDLLQVYNTNPSRACDTCTDILSYLTTARIGGPHSTWKGTTENFLLHWEDQFQQHAILAPKAQQLNKDILLILLQNAVSPHLDLSTVKPMLT